MKLVNLLFITLMTNALPQQAIAAEPLPAPLRPPMAPVVPSPQVKQAPPAEQGPSAQQAPSAEAPANQQKDTQSNADLKPSGLLQYNRNLPERTTKAELTAADALSEALKTGPRAAAIRAQLGITRSRLAAAATGVNPLFFFDRGLVAEDVNRIGPVMTNDQPWKLYYRLVVAKRLVNQTKTDLLTQLWSVRADVRRAYVELVVALQSRITVQQLADLSARLYAVSQKRFTAGAVPELDVFRARLAALQSEADLGVASKRVVRAQQQLNLLMGRPMDTSITIPPLPDYASDESRELLRAQQSEVLPDFNRDIALLKVFIDMGMRSRLELKSLGLQMKVNDANATLNKLNIVPNTNFADGKSTAGNPPFGPRLTAVFMTLNQELPLANVQQGGNYLYRATGTQLRFQTLSQQNQVMADISSAYNNLVAAREKIRVYQERLLADSNRMARLSRRSYEAGQSDINATLAAQQANVQTRSAYLDAVSSYASAFTDLEVAVGRPLR